ncbi:MAG: imidazole glycerol phosphate synthase subunit HisH [Actinomycetota bacterium]
MRVAVVDHGMGNLRSVAKALIAAGAEVTVTADPRSINGADALCVPGQGTFGRCMSNIAAAGLTEVLPRWIDDGKPFLGICLGMQVLFSKSDESGGGEGLGILDGTVRRLPATVRVPHIGWNTVTPPPSERKRALSEPFRSLGDGEHYYFDHSYAVHPTDEAIVTGWCDHGERFAARVETGPVLAVQFHPEKSGVAGIRLLQSWIRRS